MKIGTDFCEVTWTGVGIPSKAPTQKLADGSGCNVEERPFGLVSQHALQDCTDADAAERLGGRQGLE